MLMFSAGGGIGRRGGAWIPTGGLGRRWIGGGGGFGGGGGGSPAVAAASAAAARRGAGEDDMAL